MQSIKADPDIMHGVPCFAGTRVPVSSLFDHLKRGYPLEYFIAQFPSVKREQADGRLLERAATFGFDVFVTHDPGQLRLAGGNGSPPAAVSVIALRAPTNTMDDVRPLVVPLLEALNAFRPNTVMAIPE